MNRYMNEAELLGSLESVIEKWCDKMYGQDQFEKAIGIVWFTDTTYKQMAENAFSILKSAAALHKLLDDEGLLK